MAGTSIHSSDPAYLAYLFSCWADSAQDPYKRPLSLHATANLDPDLAPPRPGDFLYWKLGVFLWAYDGAFWRSTANPWKNELQRDEEPRHAGAVRNDVFDKAGGRKLQKWLRALQSGCKTQSLVLSRLAWHQHLRAKPTPEQTPRLYPW